MAAPRTATTRTAAPRRRSGQPPLAAVLGHGDLGTSLLFVFPLFLIYEVGVLFAPAMNGVDFVSRNVFAAVGYSRRNYLLLHVGLAVVYAIFLAYLRQKKAFEWRRLVPMLLEAGIYALTLGTFIIFVMTRVLHIRPSLAIGGLGPASQVVLSFGAGVHEELVFRLGILAGGAALLRTAGAAHGIAVALMFLVSSALFSAAHHIGAAGDPWAIGVFVYRMIAGLVFGAIFYYRSLAHACYTHALYDVYVLVLH